MNGHLRLSYDVNNERTLVLSQEKHDGPVTAEIRNRDGSLCGDDGFVIQPGEMVMLMNYYRYIKANDIRDDFINPYGRKEK